MIWVGILLGIVITFISLLLADIFKEYLRNIRENNQCKEIHLEFIGTSGNTTKCSHCGITNLKWTNILRAGYYEMHVCDECLELIEEYKENEMEQ